MIPVAGYCRVSTDREDQANSFSSQCRFFREYIQRQPEWELYEIYADEGITGTSTKKRIEFNRMMNDACAGKISLIITKEVSRFSRNILDTIRFTRELKDLGVGVIFLTDGINTMDSDAEMKLSLMASMAQEESRRTSARVKWGQTRQMERGIVFGRSMLGYDVKDGVMTVNPQGAELVRLIFQKYGMEGKGTSVIARELQASGWKTYSGSTRWNPSHIVKILKNEKYAGDLVQKKTITPDYLTHARKANQGQEPLIRITNHHEPIIDRDLWELVQSELARRSRQKSTCAGHSNRYLFSGKIHCGECGGVFVSRVKKRADGSPRRCWSCYTAIREGKKRTDDEGNIIGCGVGKHISDELAREMLKKVAASLPISKEEHISAVLALINDIVQADSGGLQQPKKLHMDLQKLEARLESAMDAYLGGQLTQEEMLKMTGIYKNRKLMLQNQLLKLSASRTDSIEKEIRSRMEAILEFQEDYDILLQGLLDQIIVFQDGFLKIKLKYWEDIWIFQLKSC